MKDLIKKTQKILTRKNKLRFFTAIFLLIVKSILEVFSIGLIIPILNFTANENNDMVFRYFPFLESIEKYKLISVFVFMFIFVYLMKTFFIIFYNAWIAKFVNNLSVDLTMQVLKKYLNNNYIFFLETNPSILVRNICSETSLFAIGLIGNLISSIAQIVFIISICIFLIFYNINTFYVILFIGSVSLLIVKISNKKFKKWGDIRQQKSALILKKINEIVGSIKEIILYNKQDFFANEFYSHNKKLAHANIFRDSAIAFTGPIIEFIGILVFFSFLLFLVIALPYSLGEITVLFGIFAFASIKLLPAVISLSRTMQSIKFNMPACNVVYEILEKPNFSNEYKKIEKNPLNKIKFENISFKYNNQKENILNRLNFEINKGDIIGVVGETGSGKTTLLNIIATLIDPTSGNIIINGSENLGRYRNIRNNIGYVSQSIYLSDDSILSNITFKNDISADEEKHVFEILKQLNLNYINQSPIDIYAPIGERGSKLSGGQIQRIGIARAIFRNPEILILDEATNALDQNTEAQILKFIFKIFEKKMIILCTHKKDLLEYCNKTFEVKNNKIIITENKKNV